MFSAKCHRILQLELIWCMVTCIELLFTQGYIQDH